MNVWHEMKKFFFYLPLIIQSARFCYTNFSEYANWLCRPLQYVQVHIYGKPLICFGKSELKTVCIMIGINKLCSLFHLMVVFIFVYILECVVYFVGTVFHFIDVCHMNYKIFHIVPSCALSSVYIHI